MLDFSPLFLLITLVICTVIIIKKSIVEHKFYKELFLINLVLIFTYTMILVFFDVIKENTIGYNIYLYSSLVTLLIVAVFFYITSSTNLNKKAFLNNILCSLEENTYYLLLNKKNKIIEISKFLCNKFDIDKENAIGKNIEYILNECITIESINDKSVSNNEFLQYLKGEIPEDLNSNLEIKFIKKDGKEDKITITEKAIYVADKFYGRMYLGLIKPIINETTEDKSDLRFEHTLNILNEGLFQYSFNNKSFTINDYLVKSLGLVGNSITLSDILYNINEDDFNNIKTLINNTTRDNNNISGYVRYKINDGTIIFLKLNISVIFNGLNKVIMVGSVLLSNTKQFIPLNSSLLDNIKLEENLNSDIKRLINDDIKFEIVTFKILDIKEINNKYTRQIGTLIIDKYLSSIINVFDIKNYIYRITGTRFAFILTDPRQMEKLTRTITNNKLLTPTLNYGNIEIKLNVIMGLSFSNDSIRREEIYSNAKYALKKAKETNKQYMFYRDLIE